MVQALLFHKGGHVEAAVQLCGRGKKGGREEGRKGGRDRGREGV